MKLASPKPKLRISKHQNLTLNPPKLHKDSSPKVNKAQEGRAASALFCRVSITNNQVLGFRIVALYLGTGEVSGNP